MKRGYDQDPEVGGPDAIDAEFGPAGTLIAPGRLGQLLRTRAALGMRPALAPATVFIPIGFLLGPYGANFVSTGTLTHLDIVLPIALATLGLFVGLAIDLRRKDDLRLLAAGNVESALTIVVVGLAASWLLNVWEVPLAHASGVIALAIGVAASASAAGHADATDSPLTRAATRIADADDVLPMIVGGYALALLRHEPPAALGFALLTCAFGALVALAGWLLFDRAHSAAERGVFVLGTVALLGGAPAFLGLSPLLAGMVAGVLWTHLPGRADQIIGDDLRRIQHPLVVLLLMGAGAATQFTPVAFWLFVPFVAFRVSAKLAGGWLVSRLAHPLAPADLGAWLVPPGLIGLAFAFNAAMVMDDVTGTAVLSAVVLGTLASELIALVVVPASEGP